MAKKPMAPPVPVGPRRLGRLTILRVAGYYPVAGLFLLLATAVFPEHRRVPAAVAPVGMSEGLDWLRWHLAVMPGGAPRWLEAVVQMLAALLLVLPIAFTYIRTRTRIKYDHSLVQTVVMLPIIVTAILVVVQDSLALAFSLAGIVAAVRFRSNLREAGDTVYIFGSIGVGFATGIHALGVAMALSLFFVILELMLWKLNLGAEFDDTFNRVCMPSGADLAAPPPDAGDVPAPAGNGPKRADDDLADDRATTLRIYVHDLAAARAAIELVLGRDAKRWRAGAVETGDGSAGVLEYRVRPRKSVGLATLRDNLLRDGAPHVIATDQAEVAARL